MNTNPIQHMTTLTYWNPLHDLLQIRDAVARNGSSASDGDRPQEQPKEALAQWVPALDLTEDDASYLVHLEIPGVDKEDVQVTLEDGALLVSGERRIENTDRRVHRSERCFGQFRRELWIPDDADSDQIEARFHNGLLQIRIAKHEARKPRRIEVLAN